MSLNLDKSGWTRVRFGDVVRNVNDTVGEPESAGIDRVIAMEHMEPGNLNISRWGTLEEGTSFSRRVKPGQTLFGKRRAYQRKIAFAEFDAICSGDILTFEADKSDLLPEFLPFLVRSDAFFQHALGTSAGSLSPRTNWRDLAKYEFELPPLDQQRRITDLLWALERSGESLKRLAERGAMVAESVRSEFLAHCGNPVVASKAFDITIGRQRSPKHEVGAYMVPYLRSANVTPTGVSLSDVKSMNFTPGEQTKFALKPGDVLVSEGSASATAVGMPAVWNGELAETVCFQNTLLRYRAIEGITLPGFVRHWCRWAFDTGQFLRVSSGTNIHHIGAGGANSMEVRLPSIEEQQVFLSKVTSAEQVVENAITETAKLDAIRDALQAEIFGGR